MDINTSNGFCLICGTRLKQNKSLENYHIKCWRTMINDIKNFDKICYKKYDYKKTICGLTKKEIEEGAEIVVNFD